MVEDAIIYFLFLLTYSGDFALEHMELQKYVLEIREIMLLYVCD